MQRVGLIGIGAAARHHAAAVKAVGAKVLVACARRTDSPNECGSQIRQLVI